jgi:hypothetical protein
MWRRKEKDENEHGGTEETEVYGGRRKFQQGKC